MRRRPLADPELPAAARPQWPPWQAPAALFGAFGAVLLAGIPLIPVVLIYGLWLSEALSGAALLALLLVQDGLLVLTALLLASSKRAAPRWHFGSAPRASGRRSDGPPSPSRRCWASSSATTTSWRPSPSRSA